jgi:hypothetical protein
MAAKDTTVEISFEEYKQLKEKADKLDFQQSVVTDTRFEQLSEYFEGVIRITGQNLSDIRKSKLIGKCPREIVDFLGNTVGELQRCLTETKPKIMN